MRDGFESHALSLPGLMGMLACFAVFEVGVIALCQSLGYGVAFGLLAGVGIGALLVFNPFSCMIFSLFVLFSGINHALNLPSGFLAIVGLVTLAWIVDQSTRLRFSVRLDLQAAWLMGIFIAILISAFFAHDIKATLESFVAYLELAFWYFLIVQLVVTEKQIKIALLAVIAATLFTAAIGILGYFTPLPFLGTLDQGFRLRGFTTQPNVLALHLLIIFPILLLAIFKQQNRYVRTGAVLLAALSFIALLGTFSRSGLIGFAVMLAVFLYHLRRNRWLLAGATAGLIGVLLWIPDVIWERLSSLQNVILDPSLRWRARLFVGAVDLFFQSPVWGIGMGNFVLISHEFTSVHKAVHNTILEIATETGIIGLFFFAGLFLTAFYQLRHARNIFANLQKKELTLLTEGLLIAYSGIIITALFHSIQQYIVVWAVFGLGTCCYHLAKKMEGRELADRD